MYEQLIILSKVQSMKYQILPITDKYIEGFCMAVDCVARERKYLAWLEGPPLEMSRTFVLNNIQNFFPHFVVVVEGSVIGWCDITSLSRPVFAHSGTLGIGLLEEYRGQGIGEKLIRTALDEAKLRGLTRVELTVREPNVSAMALYKKVGFVIEGIKRNAVRIGDHYENIVCMGLLF